jgi:hypothetical protein
MAIRFPTVNAGRLSPEFLAGNQLLSTSSSAVIAWVELETIDAAAGIATCRRATRAFSPEADLDCKTGELGWYNLIVLNPCLPGADPET